jgi:hypothetical protein
MSFYISKKSSGVDGLSAYQVALQNGFEGDQAAWLASLVGDQGPQGDQGIQGSQGDQGPQGDTGPVGENAEWFANTGGPDSSLGKDGDHFLNTGLPGTPGTVWRKVAGTWEGAGSIRGPAGADGTNGANGRTLLSGTGGNPSNDLVSRSTVRRVFQLGQRELISSALRALTVLMEARAFKGYREFKGNPVLDFLLVE